MLSNVTIDLADEFVPLFKRLGALADKHHVDLYVVGGYVRDYFLQRSRSDLDFTVVGDALAFAQTVAEEFNSRAVVYERFRTAMVPVGGMKLEFVGTRKEEYDGKTRKPIVSEGTLEDDLRRRDFTINALAIQINLGQFGRLIDLFNGLGDMQSQVLRTPLDPKTTYSDDPLRMMRLARFASQLGFAPQPETLSAIDSMADRISIVSQERISDEFLKILATPKPSVGLRILFDTGLMSRIFPDVANLAGIDLKSDGFQEYAHKDVFLHTLQVLDNLSATTDDVWTRFAGLMHDVAKPKTKRFVQGTGWTFHGHEELGARWQRNIFRRMKFPLEHLPKVETLVRMHQRPMQLVDEGVSDSAVRRLAFQAGEYLEDLFRLCRADITTKNPNKANRYLNNYEVVFQKVIDIQERDKLKEFQSPVRGEDIMAICELQPSKAVGLIKEAIEDAILEGHILNEYEPAKEYLLQNKDGWLAAIQGGATSLVQNPETQAQSE